MISEIAGTAALSVVLVAAIAVTLVRRPDSERLVSAGLAAMIAIAVQLAHFGEELFTAFNRRFPDILGLEPWPDSFFVAFNVFWLSIWASAVGAVLVRRFTVPAAAALWFLGLAAILNGVAHPILGFATGGYFPGLVTAPFSGLAGLFLVWKLARVPGARV